MDKTGTNIKAKGANELDKELFAKFSGLIYKESGIELRDGKQGLLKARLTKRLRDTGAESFAAYFDLITKDKTGAELTGLIDAISTNVTSFFREIHHFQFLRDTLIPDLAGQKLATGEHEVRAWSAACSSGEEPYSILFTLKECKALPSDWKIKMLATDISIGMLNHAYNGTYHEDKVEKVPARVLGKYFNSLSNDGEEKLYQVKSETRKLAVFRRFNLMAGKYPFKHKFDFIFCRNVMIYFDNVTRNRLLAKFHDALADGGYLFIGHSESLARATHDFKYIAPTIYRKI